MVVWAKKSKERPVILFTLLNFYTVCSVLFILCSFGTHYDSSLKMEATAANQDDECSLFSANT